MNVTVLLNKPKPEHFSGTRVVRMAAAAAALPRGPRLARDDNLTARAAMRPVKGCELLGPDRALAARAVARKAPRVQGLPRAVGKGAQVAVGQLGAGRYGAEGLEDQSIVDGGGSAVGAARSEIEVDGKVGCAEVRKGRWAWRRRQRGGTQRARFECRARYKQLWLMRDACG